MMTESNPNVHHRGDADEEKQNLLDQSADGSVSMRPLETFDVAAAAGTLLSIRNRNRFFLSQKNSHLWVVLEHPSVVQQREVMKFLFGAGGIYGAFLYYGSLQEDVFRFRSPDDGSAFTQAWLLQFLEAAANVVVAYVGRMVTGGVPNLPLMYFGISGATQVCSKAFTSLALAKGLSFPVATLAKSGKMAPVMLGQLLLGGATYDLRDYLQVGAIILGTAILSLGKQVRNYM